MELTCITQKYNNSQKITNEDMYKIFLVIADLPINEEKHNAIILGPKIYDNVTDASNWE